MSNKRTSESHTIMYDFSNEIIDKAPIGIFLIDPLGNVLVENPALRKIFNSGAENPNPGFDLFNYINSDNKLKKHLEDAAGGKSVRIDLLKYSRHSDESDKEDKVINTWIAPVFDKQSRLEYYLFMVEDITQHAMIDSKIQRAERLTAMGVMASGIAEEIKFPLNHIMINLDFVERNTSEDSPMRSYLQAIKDDLSRIKFVSKQIRDLSLHHGGDDTELYEVNKLFSALPIKVKLNVLKERGININLSYPEKSPVIKANENHLIQALTHIIQNSAEAMPEEGTLTISVDLIKENGNSIIAITITDTGIGIAEENLSNIFKPFFTTKGHSATGLGLMVAYSIIDNLGGAIGIKSTPGAGTSVKIILPVFEG